MAPTHSKNPGSCHRGLGHLPLITRFSQKRTQSPKSLDTQHLRDFLAHMLDACPGIHVVPFVENVLQRRAIVPVAVVGLVCFRVAVGLALCRIPVCFPGWYDPTCIFRSMHTWLEILKRTCFGLGVTSARICVHTNADSRCICKYRTLHPGTSVRQASARTPTLTPPNVSASDFLGTSVSTTYLTPPPRPRLLGSGRAQTLAVVRPCARVALRRPLFAPAPILNRLPGGARRREPALVFSLAFPLVWSLRSRAHRRL
mmetsp:Transcript_9016/g.21998  ORF Transcript_9016/g.21998 Transcript_9016/m.21998 type:complete len:257 (-) Transcript_9016:829-1599(-)